MTNTPPPEPPNPDNPPPSESRDDENFVWHYRGYKMRASEFNTAMVHYYRAEINRSNTWRTRLDATTNWAVIITGAVLSLAFSSTSPDYVVILLASWMILLFLWIEARRYRYYELWSYRTRLLETDFFAAMLVPPFSPHPEWAEAMAETLLQPNFPISLWEAVGRRLRRNYLWIFLILTGAWALKVYLHPTVAQSTAEIIQRASVGPISGVLVLILTGLGTAALLVIAFATLSLHQSTGEVLPKYHDILPLQQFQREEPTGDEPLPLMPQTNRRRRRQLVAYIITDHPQELSSIIMVEMKRGITAIDGKGMYTGKAHSVLMIALTVTEVAHLKSLVRQIDANAFMIITPAQEVLGRGFRQEKHPPSSTAVS